MNKQKTFMCSDDDFMISGNDEQEIREVARMHLKDKHGMQVSEEELKAKIKEV